MTDSMVSKVKVGYEIFTDYEELADYIGAEQAYTLIAHAVPTGNFRVLGTYSEYIELPGVAPAERFATVYRA